MKRTDKVVEKLLTRGLPVTYDSWKAEELQLGLSDRVRGNLFLPFFDQCRLSLGMVGALLVKQQQFIIHRMFDQLLEVRLRLLSRQPVVVCCRPLNGAQPVRGNGIDWSG